MTTVYLNGQYLPEQQATVPVTDRGFMLADGVYEVLRAFNGKLFALDRHLARLRNSLAAIRLDADVANLGDVTLELLRRNNLRDAKAYWQVTRGSAPRNHTFPSDITPTVLVIVSPDTPLDHVAVLREAKVILHDDRRWLDCAIKSLMLLPNVLARQAAQEAGCDEAVLHRGDVVTEGSLSSAFAVVNGTLRTHPADGSILPGVARSQVLEIAHEHNVPVEERALTVDEFRGADELILTGTTKYVTAITECDGRRYPIGPITRTLHAGLIALIRRTVSNDS